MGPAASPRQPLIECADSSELGDIANYPRARAIRGDPSPRKRSAQAFPELQAALDDHVRDYDELLAYVFYVTVTEWFAERYETKDERAVEFLRWLEEEFAGADETVDNLIGVSFLEVV